MLGLDVDESSIPDAGLGLFSLVARPKGFHLVDYLGEVVSKSQIEKRYPKNTLGAYSLKLSSSLFIDSALSRGVGACANAPGKGIRPNVCFITHAGSKSARLEVVRPINAGEEIFVSYGRGYWRKEDAPHFTVDVPDWEWDLSDPFASPPLPTAVTPAVSVGTPAVSSPVPAHQPPPALSIVPAAPRRPVCPGSPTFCRCSQCTPVVPAAAPVVTPVRPSLPVVVEHLAECLGSPLDPGWHQFAFEPVILAPSAHLCQNPDISDNIDSP